MAKVRIKVIEAFDSTSGGLTGTMVKDMFRALATGVVESTKTDAIIEAGIGMCETYATLNPGRSVMPTFTVIEGRKPRGFDSATESSNPAIRKFLKREEEVA